jgi:ribosome-associated protein
MVRIPDEEISYRASRAGGPGGQHVNRRATRVEALWNVQESPSLSEDERERLLVRLARRVAKDGVLRVVADRERSQHLNRLLAARRLRELVARALRVPKPRRKTKPPASARKARLEAKRRRKSVKSLRRRPDLED